MTLIAEAHGAGFEQCLLDLNLGPDLFDKEAAFGTMVTGALTTAKNFLTTPFRRGGAASKPSMMQAPNAAGHRVPVAPTPGMRTSQLAPKPPAPVMQAPNAAGHSVPAPPTVGMRGTDVSRVTPQPTQPAMRGANTRRGNAGTVATPGAVPGGGGSIRGMEMAQRNQAYRQGMQASRSRSATNNSQGYWDGLSPTAKNWHIGLGGAAAGFAVPRMLGGNP